MTMTNEDDKKSPGYLSGFAIGAAFGAAAMFFLGTKKGRKLAKQMHKQGSATTKDLKTIVKDIETKAAKAKEEVTEVAKEKLNHIQKLQAKGRAAAEKYFQTKDTKKS